MKKSLFTLLALMLLGTASFAQNAKVWPDDPNSYFQSQFYGPFYEFNASIIAVISVDGVIQDNLDLELGVWNEVEGVLCGGHTGDYYATYPAHPEYWVTFYGYPLGDSEGHEQSVMSFLLYDHASEQVLDYVCSYRLPFVTNDVDGTARQPVVLEFFSEGQEMHFIGQGDWNDVNNWNADRLPMALDDVIIDEGAVCHMPESAIGQYASLTIEDGAMFYPVEDADITATVKKNIEPYTLGDGNNWYLLSIPVDITNEDPYDYQTAGMLNGDYDFFLFDQNYPGSDVEAGQGEWRNYKLFGNNPFKAPYNGYLYANSASTTLNFNGQLYTSGNLTHQRIPMINGVDQVGVNLVGNPYTCYAEYALGTNMRPGAVYMMNDDRDDVVVYDPEGDYDYSLIAPMAAMFVVSNRNNNNNAKITFTPYIAEDHDGEVPGIIRGKSLNQMTIEVTANGVMKDRVFVKMGEGENGPKFSINNNSTKIYVPMDGKKYAIAYTEDNTLPLCFTTSKNGIYTLNFNTKNMNCSYLHLIDNVTGVDIDLLRTPSYTFDASDSNYATRFKLVFDEQATNEIVDNFAFISNGELMINNSGEATLQVMDITGRILSSETIQNCYTKSLNLSAGVYVVRLSNGNDVKAQKIVVE